MRRRSFILLFVGVLFVIGGQPVEAQEVPEGWVPVSIDDAAVQCGSFSKRAWATGFDGDRITINRASPYGRDDNEAAALPFQIIAAEGETGLLGDSHTVQVEDGWLVGFDAGEFGGALWWFSEDGKMRKKLVDENVVGFTTASGQIQLVMGLAHLSFDDGKILRVKRDDGNWKTELLADLGAAPRTFVVESPASLLVLTTKDLVRVNLTGAFEPLLQTRYQSLYPNSMTLGSDGSIHIGMRHFITRLTRTATGYKENWYVPKDCQRFELHDRDCVCLSEMSGGLID